MKTAIVLAGRHKITKDQCQPIVEEFQENGWENVIFYEPNWQINSVDRLVSNFIASLPKGSEPLAYIELPKTGHEIEASIYQEAIKKVVHTIA